GPGMLAVKFVRMRCYRAQPELIVLEMGEPVHVKEVNGRIDQRALAVVPFQRVEEDLHFRAYRRCRWPQLAAWRQMVPLHVEHRGQGGRISRHVADEPLRLLDCRPAEIE